MIGVGSEGCWRRQSGKESTSKNHEKQTNPKKYVKIRIYFRERKATIFLKFLAQLNV
jgi:hypothetical protein